MQLSSITRSLYTSAASIASNAKLGGSHLLSGAKFTLSYTSATAYKVADLSLQALSSASYYTIQGAKSLQSNSKIVFFAAKSSAASIAANTKLASSYLASKAKIAGSYLASGAKVTAFYLSAAARKAAAVSQRILSNSTYYATEGAKVVKNNPKITLLTIAGIGAAATVAYLAHRHFKAVPTPPVAPASSVNSAPASSVNSAPASSVNSAPASSAPANSVSSVATPRELPVDFKSNEKQKVTQFLARATRFEITAARKDLGVGAANYKVANWIQRQRATAVV